MFNLGDYGMTTGLQKMQGAEQFAPTAASQAALNAPLAQGAQQAYNLGGQYLGTSPQAQAAKYYADQQALLETNRSRDYAGLENRLAQQGRLGLATGATGRMGAANPEMEAFMNAQRQQDLGLAAQATQGGMDYAKFGAGMIGTGGQLTSQGIGLQTQAYDPYKQALGVGTGLAGFGMGAAQAGSGMLGDIAKLQAGAYEPYKTATGLGMDYSKFGTDMTNAGGSTLQNMYATQNAAYAPYQTAMGGVQNLEQLAQQARTMGIDLGKMQSDAGYRAAGLGSQIGSNALEAAYQATSPAAQYDDYLAQQQAAIQGMTPLQRALSSATGTAAEKQMYLQQLLGQTNMFAQSAAGIPNAGGVVKAPMAQPAATATEISPWGSALANIAGKQFDWSKLWGGTPASAQANPWEGYTTGVDNSGFTW